MNKILILFFAGLFTACANGKSRWIAEDESGAAKIAFSDGRIDITAPQGLTLWYDCRLSGNYRIRYTARMITENGERLSDLNCFWAASDPLHPDDLFARARWRGGVFRNYNSLDLFYVGYGGNENTTTRFRRYHGDRFGAPDSEVKPLLGEYTDPSHLLAHGTDYSIVITVQDTLTTFAVNNEVLFSQRLSPGDADGYFGLRLLDNHVIISGFKIEYL